MAERQRDEQVALGGRFQDLTGMPLPLADVTDRLAVKAEADPIRLTRLGAEDDQRADR